MNNNMLFMDFYELYKDKVESKKKISKLETWMCRGFYGLLVIAILIQALYYIHNNLWGIWAVFMVFTVIILAGMYIMERKNKEASENSNYKSSLEEFCNELRAKNMDTEEKLNELINWTDRYSKTDSMWVKLLTPVDKICTTVMLPAILIYGEKCFSNSDKTQWVLFNVLYLLLVWAFSSMVFPGAKYILQKENRIALRMKEVLMQLKLWSL